MSYIETFHIDQASFSDILSNFKKSELEFITAVVRH